ncbi:MAG: carboxypeptidase regulatory-like domain-containing protein [Gemmatimonadaceae bacterium]
MPGIACHTWIVTLLGLLLTTDVLAQTVQGTVTESATRLPVNSAIVILLDTGWIRVAATFSTANGSFLLRAPRPDRYRLRAERVGHAATMSPVFQLRPEQVLERNLTMESRPTMLDAVTVTADARCIVRPGSGRRTAALWEEARKALYATALAYDERLFRTTVSRYERELDPESMRVRQERRWRISGVTENPFESLAADTLARGGYARSTDDATWLYAPDADVLLSDSFLDGHCFQAVLDDARHEGLIGLAFEPHGSGQRGRVDVRGVLWLDVSSSELRFLEFSYTGLAAPFSERGFGGRVDFRHLDTGAWIVDRWYIQLPIQAIARSTVRLPGTFSQPHTEARIVLGGIREEGGEVLSVVTRGGQQLDAPPGATLAGSVTDSTTGTSLAGARVFISGTQYTAVTDMRGRFLLADLPGGKYSVSFLHPRLSFLGLVADGRDVVLRAGDTTTVSLALPPLRSVVGEICSGLAMEDVGAGAVVGTVRLTGSATPAVGARVRVSWTAPATGTPPRSTAIETIETRTDAAGSYRACGIPVGAQILVEATIDDGDSGRAELRLRDDRIARQDFMLGDNRTAATAGNASDVATGREAVLLVLHGFIRGTGGEPVPEALVTDLGTDRTVRADERGEFTFTGLTGAKHILEIRRIGYVPARVSVRLRPRAHNSITLALDRIPAELDPVMIAARSRDFSGFESRRDRGAGYFITRRDIEGRGAVDLADVLRGVPGIELRPVPSPLGGVDYLIQSARSRGTTNTGVCPMNYYIDGVQFEASPDGVGPFIDPGEIEAIEIYQASEVPPQFRGRTARCGVVVVWTRRAAGKADSTATR